MTSYGRLPAGTSNRPSASVTLIAPPSATDTPASGSPPFSPTTLPTWAQFGELGELGELGKLGKLAARGALELAGTEEGREAELGWVATRPGSDFSQPCPMSATKRTPPML